VLSVCGRGCAQFRLCCCRLPFKCRHALAHTNTQQGADPWATDRLGGRNALHYATRSNSFEIMQQLVEAAGATGPVQFPNRPNTK
jgi:ankyrin repeat protein